jgi:predicted TIM-barrel fold metal-dependent hydrolase
MWGTDQPGMLAHANYPQLLRLAQLHAQFLSPHERDLVLGGNAWRLYGRPPG